MIANGPIAGHPIASPMLRRGGDSTDIVEPDPPRGGGSPSREALRRKQDDEDIMAVIMAFTLKQ